MDILFGSVVASQLFHAYCQMFPNMQNNCKKFEKSAIMGNYG